MKSDVYKITHKDGCEVRFCRAGEPKPFVGFTFAFGGLNTGWRQIHWTDVFATVATYEQDTVRWVVEPSSEEEAGDWILKYTL